MAVRKRIAISVMRDQSLDIRGTRQQSRANQK